MRQCPFSLEMKKIMLMKNNILILSAGRRVELVKSFCFELKNRFTDAYVFAADIKPQYSAACQVAHGCFEVPNVKNEAYIAYLLELCKKNNIGIVIPTIDTELYSLSLAKQHFEAEGINIIISSTDLIINTGDKRKSDQLFKLLGIPYPEIYSHENIKFPCFVKPYNGSCSNGTTVIDKKENLTKKLFEDNNIIYQELIDSSFNEYTVDAYYNMDGKLICLVPRERIEVRAGEISKGITRKNIIYDYLKNKLNILKGARGCITFQLFARIEDEVYYAIEINPRFGGGYPLSYFAGANYPGWIIDEYIRKKIIKYYEDWEDNLMMLRYDSQILIHEKNY